MSTTLEDDTATDVRERGRTTSLHRLAFFAFLAASLAVVALSIHDGTLNIPPRWNPWAPLDIAEEPNALTRFKLARLERDPALCLGVLATTTLRFRVVPDRDTGAGCGFHNAVSITSGDVSLGGALTLTCPASVALALWERHDVEPAADAHFGQRVVRIDHFGSYACRNVYGREHAPRSEHATANAIDVEGFVFADGRRVRVVNDWNSDSNASKFLREVDAGACRWFDAVLSPAYNAAHRDHLHLDRGRYRACW